MKRSSGHHPLYFVWRDMVHRCTRPDRRGYDRYGARGIRVCERWRTDFHAFVADMGPRPSPEHQLDRVDNAGNYEPTNCRWATRVQQARNSRGCKLTTSAVAEIKLCLAVGESIKSLALRHGVVCGAIYNIREGITWADVPPATEVSS